jgi:hypothetical protein
MKSPERLVEYARTFGDFVVLLPSSSEFPSVVAVGLRENGAGRPQGIEADFLRLVATSRERLPDGPWPQGPLAAQSLRFDGRRLVVRTLEAEYRLFVDPKCPVDRISCTATPGDFERLGDPELLAAYIADRPHERAPLSVEMHAPQMRIDEPKRARTVTQGRQRPLYERPSTAKTVAWLLIGALLIVLGARWLGLGMRQGVVVNFYGWAMIALGAVLVVRRSLDLIFPPSRL